MGADFSDIMDIIGEAGEDVYADWEEIRKRG